MVVPLQPQLQFTYINTPPFRVINVSPPHCHNETEMQSPLGHTILRALSGVVHRCCGDARSEDGRRGHGVAVTRWVAAGARVPAPALLLQLSASTTGDTWTSAGSLARVWTTGVASARFCTRSAHRDAVNASANCVDRGHVIRYLSEQDDIGKGA